MPQRMRTSQFILAPGGRQIGDLLHRHELADYPNVERANEECVEYREEQVTPGSAWRSQGRTCGPPRAALAHGRPATEIM